MNIYPLIVNIKRYDENNKPYRQDTLLKVFTDLKIAKESLTYYEKNKDYAYTLKMRDNIELVNYINDYGIKSMEVLHIMMSKSLIGWIIIIKI